MPAHTASQLFESNVRADAISTSAMCPLVRLRFYCGHCEHVVVCLLVAVTLGVTSSCLLSRDLGVFLMWVGRLKLRQEVDFASPADDALLKNQHLNSGEDPDRRF